MRVLVMDTGRGINADKVAMWRSHLGLEPADQLVLVSWFAPQAKSPLPVTAHMVCGPVLRLGQEPVHWPVRAAEQEADVSESSMPHEADVPWGVDEAVTDTAGGLSTSELDEQLTEQEAEPSQAAAADQDPPEDGEHDDLEGDAGLGVDLTERSDDHQAEPEEAAPVRAVLPTNLSHLPVYHPRRVRQAVRWRRKWAQRRARRFASRQVRRARGFTNGTRHLPSTVVSTALRPRKDAISWEYTLATTRSETVNALFRTADVVVPVDQRSQKAAWLLARRHAGPDVIVTLPAAARAVASRRAAA